MLLRYRITIVHFGILLCYATDTNECTAIILFVNIVILLNPLGVLLVHEDS